jgi:RNA polymerase sigma factor (sigma-70 family)
LARGATPPEWSLDQVFAWLHGVLHYVVREECARVGFHREVPIAADSPGRESFDPADPAPDPLEGLIQSELRDIVSNCLPRLEREQREVIRMRMEGLTYSEIAARLRVNENTVATWIARGTRWLAQCVRRSTAGKIRGVPHA